MHFRKITALLLAFLFIFGAMMTAAGCNNNNGGEGPKKDEPPKSRRTNVFGATEIKIPEDIGYTQNVFCSDTALYLTFSTDYTTIIDADGNEVETRKGYYWQENGGVNLEYPDDEVIIYGTYAAEDSYVPVDTKPAQTGGPDEPEDLWNKHVDEVTEGSSENALLLPDKWTMKYRNVPSVCVADLDKNSPAKYTSKVIDIDIEDQSNENGGSSMVNIFVNGDGDLVMLREYYRYGSGQIDYPVIPKEEIETEEEIVTEEAETNDDFSEPSDTGYDIDEPIDITDDYEYRHWYTIDTIDLSTGKIKDSKDLSELFESLKLDMQNTWLYQVAYDSDGTLAVTIDTSILFIGKDGSLVGKSDIDGWVNNIMSVGKGFIIMSSDDMGNIKYQRAVNGQVEPLQLEGLDSNTYYGFLGGNDNVLYLNGTDCINAYDLTTGQMTEYLNYINCDVEYFGGSVAGVLSDGRVCFISNRYGGGIVYDSIAKPMNPSQKMTVEIYERIPDEDMAEEVLVTIGSAVNDYNLVRSMIRFNKRNTGVRVQLESYEKYNDADTDWRGGYDQFNKDLSTGKVPDIIFMNENMPVESLYRNKVFEDISRYVATLDSSKYLTNIFDATKVGEKMYSLILTFSIQTMFAKSKFVGTEPGWTFEKFTQLLSTMPEGMEAFWGQSRNEIMEIFFQRALNSLVNWDTGETEFETKGFIDFIKYLKNCRETNIYEEFYGQMGDSYDEDKYRQFEEMQQLRYFNDKALLELLYMNDMTAILQAQQEFATKDITAIGYPCRSGNGAIIVPQTEMAIGARSKAKDQAWEFIKFVLEDDDFYNNYWGFCVNKEYMDNKAATAKDNWWGGEDYIDEWTLNWWKESGYSEEYINYQTSRNVQFSEEAVQQAYDIVKGATMVARTDLGLVEIIKDELSSFFGGTKSAEETARIIAGRARTYISEHS
ncbi:MAG: extracellular solute-binding protein [Clostridia bacterium]|nr:extracellular solute-binding protein [Clostridia bacterium]